MASSADRDTQRVYIGTGAGHAGIEMLQLDLATGELRDLGLAGKLVNPTFLALVPGRSLLLAVSETRAGHVASFGIDATSGKLTLLSEQESGGDDPCHIAADASGRYALVSNYSSGTIRVLPIDAAGRLGAPTTSIQHPAPVRADGTPGRAHAHGMYQAPGSGRRIVLACDLGLDQVRVYAFDSRQGTLAAHEPPFASLAPRAGPRHLAFHPSGRWVYVINELDSTVTVFGFDGAAGRLSALQTLPTTPPGFAGNNSTAEIEVDRAGRFVYGSNRGHDSIVVYAVAPDRGTLTPVSWHATLGTTPRHFALHGGGRWLLAANQGTGNVVVFAVEARTGALTPAGHQAVVPSAQCVVFA